MQLRRHRTLVWAGLIVVLLGLLGLLSFFQFRWINDVTTAERERMQAHLRAAAERLVREFDRELMRACLVFLVAPFEWREGHWRNVGEHYKVWSQTAAYPKLVRDVYLTSGQDEGVPGLYRFDPRVNRLDTVPWPSGFSPLRNRLEPLLGPNPPASRQVPRPAQWTIKEEIPALVLYVFEFRAFLPRANWLSIRAHKASGRHGPEIEPGSSQCRQGERQCFANRRAGC